jgi:hypothetical protein
MATGPESCDEVIAPAAGDQPTAVGNADLEAAWKENGRLATTLDVLKQELADRLAEVQRLSRSAEDLITARAERDQAAAGLDAARAEVEELQARLGDAEELCQRLEARYQSVSIDHARENEENFRVWETERQELILGWRQDLRFAQEEAAGQAGGLHAAALRREEQLHTELADAHQQFAQEAAILRTRVDVLERELDVARADCERFERELGEARQREELAIQREDELIGQIKDVRRELESRQQELDAVRKESDGIRHRDDSRPRLAAECEASSRCDVGPESPNEKTSELPQALAPLQAKLEELQQERDLAIEQAGTLRVDRDRLHDNLARIEARLQVAECRDQTSIEPLERELADLRRALAAAVEREAELRIQLDAAQSSSKPDRVEEALPACEIVAATATDTFAPCEETCAPNVNESEPPAGSAAPIALDESDSQPPTPELPPLVPLPDESPEVRIQRLRSSLRADHEGRSEGPLRPLLSRMGRILRSRRSER